MCDGKEKMLTNNRKVRQTNVRTKRKEKESEQNRGRRYAKSNTRNSASALGADGCGYHSKVMGMAPSERLDAGNGGDRPKPSPALYTRDSCDSCASRALEPSDGHEQTN